MLKNIKRFWRTVKHLKPVQVRYQLYYRWRRFVGKTNTPGRRNSSPSVSHVIHHTDWISAYETYTDGCFCFLNKKKRFEKSIDWNFAAFGALWTYNLTYFDYLMQPDMDMQTGLELIHDFIESIESVTRGLDPYPISLRASNWIKFCLKYNVHDAYINDSLYAQLLRLKNNPEYHLLGNHLFENGCALLIGGLYFDESEFRLKGQHILEEQLDEQVLADGAHFERSPMYHQILLLRLLDCCNLLKNTSIIHEKFKHFVCNKTELMLGWLHKVTFSNGTVPRVNDATKDVAPTTSQLLSYARRMGLNTPDINLNNSGYRMIKNDHYEWFIDVGNIGPDYIPGHAHSDTFTFILHVHEKPIIVDTGISTYEECDRRLVERSTAAHNTVLVNKEEQTEVWRSFRVGRRAYITKLEEGDNFIAAEHNGYKHLGCNHRRTFKWDEHKLYINDDIIGGKKVSGVTYIHFHPQVNVEQKGQTVMADDIKLFFSGHDRLQKRSYQYAEGFNQLKKSSVLKIEFKNKLKTQIKIT